MLSKSEQSELKDSGFFQLRGVLSAAEARGVSAKFRDIPSTSAGQRWIGRELAALLADETLMPIRSVLHSLVVRPVALRAVAFRKCVDANWSVPPHQDRSIPIPSRGCPEGFSRRTRKSDGWQAEAPISLLERMYNLRIFIDPAKEVDGPLQVLPGSHRDGRLTHADIANLSEAITWFPLTGDAGDIVALSPLLAHRSRSADNPRGRRIIQIEILPFEVVSSHRLIGQEIPPPSF